MNNVKFNEEIKRK